MSGDVSTIKDLSTSLIMDNYHLNIFHYYTHKNKLQTYQLCCSHGLNVESFELTILIYLSFRLFVIKGLYLYFQITNPLK